MADETRSKAVGAAIEPLKTVSPEAEGLRWRNTGLALLALLAMTILVCSVMTGASAASLGNVLAATLSGQSVLADPMALRDRIVIVDIRLPRAILGFLTGAALSVAGAVMQGLFRNPLADPGVIGVSSGAALGAVLMIVVGESLLFPLTPILASFALPVAAFAGGLAVTAILYRLAASGGEIQIATLLIAGIAIAALAGAITGILVYLADDRQLRDLTFWNLGSLAGASWQKAAIAAAVVLPGLAMLPALGRGLNAFTLGEATAFHMGIPVERFKRMAIVLVAAVTGVSVALTGGIGFVGIVVPHLVRLAAGPDHRFLMPASALLGGCLLVGADMFARTVVAPAELPIGIVTALIGAPFFLFILLKDRSGRLK